jgi:sec-independent protein translocase protein TatA
MIGTSEIIVIALVAFVLLFGAGKVPELARSLGLALGEFKKAQREAELGLKKFEESATGEEALPRSKAKSKTKTEEVTVRELAAYMGIDTEGKTEEELKEEVKAKLVSSRSH